ncbi:hypothetical protein Tco_0902786 [Tanacetum coccineum]
MSLSLAKNVIVAWAENRPLMLDKTQYSSWASRMLLYIKGKENSKLRVDSVLNGPFKYGTVTIPETQTTPATERESKLYDEFDMFTSVPGETIHSYYLSLSGANEALVANHSSVVSHQSYQAPDVHQPPQASYQPIHFVLVVPSFLPTDDPIERQNQSYASSGTRNNATTLGVNRTGGTNTAGQAKMEFLTDNEDTVTTGQQSQEIPTLAAFQTDDLDAFDSDCDEAPTASAILMAKLSSYDSKILSWVLIHDNYLDNHVIDQNV